MLSAEHMPEGFHARHSTIAKTYEYRVFAEAALAENLPRRICPPFLARYAYSFPWPLSLDALNEAAALFVGTYDFRSFAATDPVLTARSSEAAVEDEQGESQKSAVRPSSARPGTSGRPRTACCSSNRVRGSGFLHHMVRNLVGTMIDVGRGYTPRRRDSGMIAARARAAAGPTAPARGLFLQFGGVPPE